MKSPNRAFYTLPAAAVSLTAAGNPAVNIPNAASRSEAPAQVQFASKSAYSTPDRLKTVAKELFSTSAKIKVHVPVEARKEWTRKMEQQFDSLVEKEALGDLSDNEARELEQLQLIRRNRLNPPTGEELLMRYKQAKLDQEIIHLLSKYVRIKSLQDYSA